MPQMLGKQAAVHDPRTVKLADYVTPALQPVPDASDWTAKLPQPYPVNLNDRIGCCAIAMVANARRCWTANDAKAVASITDGQVLSDYSKISGYRPGIPSTDVGCVMLDVLKAWRRDGLCGGKIGAFASVNPIDPQMAKIGVHIFGGLLMGVQLPAAVQGKDEWKAPDDPRYLVGEWGKGSWGGHAIVAEKYDADGLYVRSWDKIIFCSWNFYHWYSDETYVAVAADWLGADFTAPNGIGLSDMLKDVGALV